LDAARHRLDDTIAMLQQAAPELAGEICGLASEVIFVDSLPRAGESALESASTFYLWGAVFLNAKAFPDRVAMAEALTHEGAHALLHGLMLGSPLVENDEYERYSSPLRPDARPLEGVVHATYVLARMHYCVEQLLRSGCLTDAERAQASAALAAHKAAYRDGLATVAAHARFTAAGAAIFDAARDYMRTRIPQDLTT
jgi:HEXXH motif-containing protein